MGGCVQHNRDLIYDCAITIKKSQLNPDDKELRLKKNQLIDKVSELEICNF